MEHDEGSVPELLRRIGEKLDTSTVFGEARMLDGSAIIPVARISYGGGGGSGSEPSGGEEQHGEGVGFGVVARPLGVIEVRHESLRWVPVVDWGRLAVLWSVVVGLFLLFGLGRPRRVR